EAIEHFASLGDLTGFVIEDAERGIAAGPFGKEFDSAFELQGGLGRVAIQDGDDAEAPLNFSRARDALQPFLQSRFGGVEIVLAELHESERKIGLVVIGVATNGVMKDFGSAGGIAEMSVNVSQ